MGRNDACETHEGEIQGCDSKVVYTASNANPVANIGGFTGRPVGSQDVLRVTSDMSLKSNKSRLVCGDGFCC